MNDKDKKKIIEECNMFIKTDEGKEIKKFWNKHSSELMMILCSDHKLLTDALMKIGFTIHIGTNAESVNFEFTANDVIFRINMLEYLVLRKKLRHDNDYKRIKPSKSRFRFTSI